jgi:predicted lipoprotein with Yx(FWY)xxD motif
VIHSKRIGLLFVAVALAAACGGSSPTAPTHQDDFDLASDANLGTHLTTGAGRTLYYYTLDVPAAGANAPVSNCTDAGGCLETWPIFHGPASPSLGGGLNAADFTEFTRADGVKQTAYKGWPLYTYGGDTKAGDVKGENFTQSWFVLKDPFYTVLIVDKPSLHFLATASGKTVYTFKNDVVGSGTTPPTSACTTATCLGNFPPFYDSAPVVPTGVDASAFGHFTRADGNPQSTYKGHPLYLSSKDAQPGDTNGNNFNNAWFVVDPTK